MPIPKSLWEETFNQNENEDESSEDDPEDDNRLRHGYLLFHIRLLIAHRLSVKS